MKEFWELLKKMDIKGIMIEPTNNSFLQFIRYVFVGGIATIVDWGALYLLTEKCHLVYLISAIFAFILGLMTNFVLSKMLVFKAAKAKVMPMMEFIHYGLIGIVGLGMTELILWGGTKFLGMHYMVSKIIATFIVLFWNYIVRKKLLYEENSKEEVAS